MAASTETNPFDDPFGTLDVAESETASKSSVPEWTGAVPPSATAWVGRAIASGKRQIIVCDNIELRGRLHSAVKAALALQNKDLAIHTRDRIAEDGTLTHFTFTVGQPRGRKSDDSE